ncbi:MAG: maleylpyruvate isomerase family mycothiol-dependent enzyme, partial [Streptosporangiales bacterium]|nr:maleylpyruvate isomerase family mycothiol-dependent enzyme [Streptosporangiales bacterium]
MGVDHAELTQDIDAATRRLLDTVATLDDGDVRAPSLLPGWTRGHVLTHVARNADGLVNLLGWVHGERTPMYESREARNRDIDAGSGRSAQELLADVEASADRFAAALAAVPDDGWDTPVVWGNGAHRTTGAIPAARLLEVEVHHVDLDAGYRYTDWPEPFVGRLLDDVTAAVDAPPMTIRVDGAAAPADGAPGPVITGPAA